MMNPTMTGYGWSLLLAVGAAALLLVVSMKRRGQKGAWLLCVLSAVLSVVGARAYYILMQNVLGRYPMFGSVISFYPYEHAMCGAVIGVIAALAATAKLTKQPFGALADTLAPAGLLAIAIARCGEVFSDFGWGLVMNDGPLFFPFAVQDMFGQWHGAVFFMEAAFALAVMAYALRVKTQRDGQRFALALTLWAVTQIFCESFRAETLRWGFVRVQQVQCAVFALIVLAVYFLRIRDKQKALYACWGVFFACVGVVVLMEYALDKLPLPLALDYAIMAFALAVMFLTVRRVVGRACSGE